MKKTIIEQGEVKVGWQARQGDVFLEKIDDLPTGLEEVKPDVGRVILAYGEATGHAHTIPSTHARHFRAKGSTAETLTSYLSVTKATKLSHEEHGPIPLKIGNYEITTQREYTPAGIERVVD